MEIIQIDDVKMGMFQAREAGTVAGELVYTWSGNDKIIINHTEVKDGFEGKGVGKKMLMEAIKFAREKHIKILPVCPFAKAVMEKSDEYQDVLF